jgi:GNAT superfamily N-acetyltransferase
MTLEAKGLIQELIDWDVRQCENLGFERAEVIRTFYPDGLDDIRHCSAAPGGCFLIASGQSGPAGCAGYRPLEATTCELHNVYVRANYRGGSIGALLVKQLQRTAIAAGYRTMYLETASFMKDAHRLYRWLQFEVVAPYRPIPERFVPVTISMRCALREC